MNPPPDNHAQLEQKFSGSKNISFDTNQETFDTPVFIFWFRAYLTDDISISSHPKEADYACHWSPMAVVLNKKIDRNANIRVQYQLSPRQDMIECQVFDGQELIGVRC